MDLWLPRERLQDLLDALRDAGYRCVGPQVRDGAIVYDTLDDADRLPAGVTDRQAPGEYRLEAEPGPRRFAWANGPQALKPLVFTPRETLWRAERDAGGALRFTAGTPAGVPTAVIGVRACDLAALALQDRHFLAPPCPDPLYAARRRTLLLVAVECSHPADTCFCASTGDGPQVDGGADLRLAELDDGYVIAATSEAGSAVLATLDLDAAGDTQRDTAAHQLHEAAAQQVRALPGHDLKDALFANLGHPQWEAVAERCLACGNCTSVCPTCFCHRESAQGGLDPDYSEQVREWDSCFSAGHAALHGFNVRADIRTRYRQWLTHKLGSWHDQYGRSGCVGCGRCIAWCPVGIDITEEVSVVCGAPT